MGEAQNADLAVTRMAPHEESDLRAAFERDRWAGEWNSLPTAIDRMLAARFAAFHEMADAYEADAKVPIASTAGSPFSAGYLMGLRTAVHDLRILLRGRRIPPGQDGPR